MARTITLKVSVLERWKGWLAYARSNAFSAGDRETAELLQKIWADIEKTRAAGGEAEPGVSK